MNFDAALSPHQNRLAKRAVEGRIRERGQQERRRESVERAWNCSRSAWPSFLPSRAPQPRLSGWSCRSLAWRRGGKGEAPALALPWGTVQARAQARARAASSQRGALCCHAIRHADRWSYWKGVRTNHRHLILRTSSMDRKHPPCCHLALRPRRRPPVLSDRPCPTCLSLVTLKKEELAMGGWEEGEEGREEGE